jgi:hypothetical protein
MNEYYIFQNHRGDLCCAFEYLDVAGVKATTLC